MRSNNHLAVGSPTVRAAAIMAATLLAAMMIIGAGIAGAQLFAASGPIIVDASGDGHHSTIQAAVDAAEDGDEILVRPGTYAEEVTIEDKRVSVRGDGPVDEIIVELDDAWLFTLRNTDAQIANLTLRGDGYTQGMVVFGGAPIISGLVFDGTGAPYASTMPGDGGSLMISDSSATVTDSRFLNGGQVMVGLDADAVIENNEFVDGPHLYLQDPGDEAIVRDNTFSGTFDRAMGLFGESTMVIEGNTVDGAGGDGITVGWNSAPGHDPLIRDNDISGTKIGIKVFADSSPTVAGNRLHGNDTAIDSQSDTAAYTDNDLSGNDIGLHIMGSPMIDGNSVKEGRVGIALFGVDSAPAVTNNVICGNERNVQVSELTDAPTLAYDDSNEICEDPPTE